MVQIYSLHSVIVPANPFCPFYCSINKATTKKLLIRRVKYMPQFVTMNIK